MQRWFPIGAWLPQYNWSGFLKADLIAAVSVAALLIPESAVRRHGRDRRTSHLRHGPQRGIGSRQDDTIRIGEPIMNADHATTEVAS